jgi:hypothetical protein
VNQRLKASQVNPTSSNLTDLGWAATHIGMALVGSVTLGLVDVAGREAMVNACGVAVARLQGHSWAPTLLNGQIVNVGTTSMAPPCSPARAVGGKARRRLMLLGWGGGPVVVRAGESPVHGEGAQRVCSINADRGGRW